MRFFADSSDRSKLNDQVDDKDPDGHTGYVDMHAQRE
jgi:hypothetical protein